MPGAILSGDADSSGKIHGFLLSRTERTIAWARRPHSREPVMAVRMRTEAYRIENVVEGIP